MSGRTRSEEKKVLRSDKVVKPKRELSRGRPTKAERSPSPSKTKKTPKSPKRAGSKSPARKAENKSPSRKKSPARNKSLKEKSPEWVPPRARKSPSRISPARPAKFTSTPIIDIESDSETESKIPKPQFAIRGRSRKLSTEAFKPYTRLSASRESERIIPLKEDFVTKEKKLTEFSDEDEIITKKIELEPPKIQLKSMFRSEYGGLYGTLFLFNLIPIMTIAIEYFSEKRTNYSLDYFKKPSTYYDFYSYVGLLSFFALNFIFAKFPFGSKPEGQLKAFSTSSYIANGWFSLILTYGTWFGLEYYGIPISGYVYNNFRHIVVAGLLFGFLLSILLYIRSSYVPVGSLNPMGNTNNEIYDFFVGRQVAPSILGVHMKVFLLRTVAIAKGIFTIILLAKSLNITKPITQYLDVNDLKSLNFDPTMITICTMIYITVIDKIFFEKTLASTFELRHEGQGYLCNMQYIASAFLYPLIAKYVFENNVKLDSCTLAVVFGVFFIASVLNRASNNQKYVFRVNPYSPKVANFESIPTSQGRKLLAGGLWGLVRHPNYLTEIMMNLCLAIFVWKSPIIVYVAFVVGMLLYRARRVEYRLKQKYEMAWDRYCQKVRYMILPKVY